MKVPQMTPWLGAEELDAVQAPVAENWITEGPRSAKFVDRLKDLIGSPYAVLAPNGTLALYLGLVAAGVKPGDEVIVPDCTFIASANAVIMAGATPVFVDVNDRNCQIDLTDADDLVTDRTVAVMPVHLYGMAANMTEVMAFAQRHDLKVVEDAAQGIGVLYNGRHVGSFGDAGCFSFFADKTITTGEGGLVVCRDEGVYEQLRLLRNQGRLDRGSFVHPAIGFNFRMTDIQTSIGLAQLDKLDIIIKRKRAILRWYHNELDDVDEVSFIELEPGSTYVPFRAVLVCDRAQELARFLEEREIDTRSSFFPLHRQPCFAHLDKARGGPLDLNDRRYPNAVKAHERALLLPCFPALTREQVKHVGDSTREFYGHGCRHYIINTMTGSTPARTTARR